MMIVGVMFYEEKTKRFHKSGHDELSRIFGEENEVITTEIHTVEQKVSSSTTNQRPPSDLSTTHSTPRRWNHQSEI